MAKRSRRPGTWPYLHTPRGPDKTGVMGDAFTLASRSRAARTPYPENFKQLQPKQVTLGLRHQAIQRFVVKKLLDEPDYKIRLYISRDTFIFVRETLVNNERQLAASIAYSRLDIAFDVYKKNKICWSEFQFLPDS